MKRNKSWFCGSEIQLLILLDILKTISMLRKEYGK